jgi:hypothetical protein
MLTLQRARWAAVHGGHVGTRHREGHERQLEGARGSQHRAVRTREPCGASLSMQPLVKRHANGENTTARARAGFQDDDGCAGLVKKISRAQAGETGADDRNGLVGIGRTRGDASNDGRRERKRARRLLKKSSPIHGVLTFAIL